MNETRNRTRGRHSAMKLVRQFAQMNPGALVRASDLRGPTSVAVSKALSRMESSGNLRRVAKGVYYVPKQTLLGESAPTGASVAAKALDGRVRPHSVTAANLLGLTTQVAARPELVVYGQSAVTVGSVSIKHRRPRARTHPSVSTEDAALLEVLRDRGRFSELSDEGTVSRITERRASP